MALTYFSQLNRIGFLSFSKLFSLAPALASSHHLAPPSYFHPFSSLITPPPSTQPPPHQDTSNTPTNLPTYQLRPKHKSSAQSATKRVSALSPSASMRKSAGNFDFGRRCKGGAVVKIVSGRRGEEGRWEREL